MSIAKEALNYRFDDFYLDVANRQLWQGKTRLGLSGRYLDALVLLVHEHGQLVEKDQFFDEVWGDVVVSDAALAQCIKDVRKHLGDDAANPRYIETVPRYGYRFIGTVTAVSPGDAISGAPPPIDDPDARAESNVEPHGAVPDRDAEPPAPPTGQDLGWDPSQDRLRRALVQGSAGTLGGGIAGVLGGLLYGFGIAYTPADPQLGTASILTVLITLNVVVGIIGGGGVSFGLAAAGWVRRSQPGWNHPGWSIAGAALGGMLVGGLAKLLGVDAFTLLFGRAPAGITGGLEGAVLGAALALGAQWGGGLGAARVWRPVIGAGLAGTAAGVLIPIAGGHLMGGSLDLLARSFANSRLQLDALGRFFGEVQFGATTQVILGGVEGLVFGSCVVGAIVLAQRLWLTKAQPSREA